jgi:hypothetical protein
MRNHHLIIFSAVDSYNMGNSAQKGDKSWDNFTLTPDSNIKVTEYDKVVQDASNTLSDFELLFEFLYITLLV